MADRPSLLSQDSVEANGDTDQPPYLGKLGAVDARRRWANTLLRCGGGVMGQGKTGLGAAILGGGQDTNGKVGDGQVGVFGKGYQDDIWVGLVEQVAVLDHDGWSPLVRLLRQRVAPVHEDDLTGGQAQGFSRSAVGVPHWS